MIETRRLNSRVMDSRWGPEALLAISVISLSPVIVRLVLSSFERGSGEWQSGLAVLAAIIPSCAYLRAVLSEAAADGRHRLGLFCQRHDFVFRAYSLALLTLTVAQLTYAVVAWHNVGAFELPGIILLSYFVIIPFHVGAVAFFTGVCCKSAERSTSLAVRASLVIAMVLFMIVAMRDVGSTIAT